MLYNPLIELNIIKSQNLLQGLYPIRPSYQQLPPKSAKKEIDDGNQTGGIY
jgi:hypothetical protein